MVILIAESKTMGPCDGRIDAEILHTPVFESEATRIMTSLEVLTTQEISEAVKISPAMVRKLRTMAYEFPNKELGATAITAFTGVVFRAFGYSSLTVDDKARTAQRVRIVSSLYGWLKPDDIVKPYRLDFTTPLAPGGTSFAAFWRPKVTDCLKSFISSANFSEILDLLPGDAARCIDWKRIGEEMKVWKADFKEVIPGGKLRTPNAGKLKTLRGELLRHIIKENINDPRQLGSLEGENFAGMGTDETQGIIYFHTV